MGGRSSGAERSAPSSRGLAARGRRGGGIRNRQSDRTNQSQAELHPGMTGSVTQGSDKGIGGVTQGGLRQGNTWGMMR